MESPNAAKTQCTKAPEAIPKADNIPAFLPCEILLPRIYIVSAPGVRFKSIPANKNAVKFMIPNMFFEFNGNHKDI
ncbi:hypothetical protein MHTCC0001_28590 [Flavobacteriaceae bacterium MHTCC 0001]